MIVTGIGFKIHRNSQVIGDPAIRSVSAMTIKPVKTVPFGDFSVFSAA
jgi:hypothetical protein